tara:strand:+ start:487 stop:825 length:339 start_codon:yes stop_codon:yes gene_type:complete
MKVGSYVVCTDDKFSAEQLTKLQTIPKEGNYYTIRDIVEYPNLGRAGVRLEEISNPDITLSDGAIHEPTFSIFRFMELEIPPSIEQEISEVLDQEFELVETEDDRLLREIRN